MKKKLKQEAKTLIKFIFPTRVFVNIQISMNDDFFCSQGYFFRNYLIFLFHVTTIFKNKTKKNSMLFIDIILELIFCIILVTKYHYFCTMFLQLQFNSKEIQHLFFFLMSQYERIIDVKFTNRIFNDSSEFIFF